MLRTFRITAALVFAAAFSSIPALALPVASGVVTIDGTETLTSDTRVIRDGVTSTIATPKPYPGDYDCTGGICYFRTVALTPLQPDITVKIVPLNGGIDVFTVAYQDFFDVHALSTNYLGDPGGSGARSFSFTVPPGSTLVLAFMSIGDVFGSLTYEVTGAYAVGAQEVRFGPPPLLAVGGTAALTATGGASGNPIVFTSLAPEVCSVQASTAAGLRSGFCTIAADQAGNANYLAGHAELTLEVFVPPKNHTGMYWNPGEAGWGVNVSHQESVLVATIFTYASDGTPMWLIASRMARQADGSFSGDLFRLWGTPFHKPWGGFDLTKVGSASLAFSGQDAGVLSYNYRDTSGFASSVARITKPITRYACQGLAASCVSSTGTRALEKNLQDLWWAPAEPGWGLTVVHQGSVIFAVLYTYDDNGNAFWLSASNLARQSDGTYRGGLYRTVAPGFIAGGSWNGTRAEAVGSMTLRPTSGETAVLDYVVDGRFVEKSISRYVFGGTVPVCH